MLVLFFFILLPGLLPIEMERLRECMKNSARLKELGLADPYAKMLAEYGLQDNTDEGDLIDDENSKVLIPPCCQVLTCFSSLPNSI